MVTKMLLNNNIQFYFCSNDLKFSKGNKCNHVHYWNFLKIKFEQNSNNVIWTKYQ
jgi:hypothetical protein